MTMTDTIPLHLGVCIVAGKLHATVMRRESNGHVTVVATAEIDESMLRRPGYDTHAVMRAHAPTRVLTEHSGCGQGAQVDQLSVTLHPGDRVLLEMGKYSAALAKQPTA
jgi:hypothetical protein